MSGGAVGKHSAADRLVEARRQLLAYLNDRGLRWTRQRDAVLQAFVEADAHLSVEELLARVRELDPTMGPATVYRTVGLFVAAGIAKERRFHDERLRYEPAVAASHHDHLICTECGAIEEFEDERIERLQELIAETRGFTVTRHRMELYGQCRRCREAAGEAMFHSREDQV